MSIRRTVRRTIQTGSSIYATVEEYNLGKATVRLIDNGARLTNLSTIGKAVSPGDMVIIDYSAGVNPIVRPSFEQQSSTTPPEAIDATSYTEDEEQDPIFLEDVGAAGLLNDQSYPIYKNTYAYLPFKYNNSTPTHDYDMAGYWETGGGWIDWDTYGGRDYIEVQKTGKYIIQTEWLCWHSHVTDWIEFSGHTKFRIYKNETIISEWIGRWGERSIYSSTRHSFIYDLEEGDKIYREYYQNLHRQTTTWSVTYDHRDWINLSLQYIPGT